MHKYLYLTFTCLLVGLTPTILFGQPSEKPLVPPTRKLIDEGSIDQLDLKALRLHLHNAIQYCQLQNEANTSRAISYKNQADSLRQSRAQLQTQQKQLQQLKQENRQYEKQGAIRKSYLDSVDRLAAQLNYDRQLLTDPRVVRIYKFPLTGVRKTLFENLTNNKSGFSYEGEPSANKLVVTRQFNKQTEAWWGFDKNNDSLLEVTLRLLEHPFDSQRAIVYADTKLLQKSRSAHKLYEDQSDPERLTLYRDRTLRLLEGFLKNTLYK